MPFGVNGANDDARCFGRNVLLPQVSSVRSNQSRQFFFVPGQVLEDFSPIDVLFLQSFALQHVHHRALPPIVKKICHFARAWFANFSWGWHCVIIIFMPINDPENLVRSRKSHLASPLRFHLVPYFSSHIYFA